MPEDRQADYLDELDALAAPDTGWDTFPPSYDEWNALRAAVGLPLADFDAYLVAIDVINWTPAAVPLE